MVVCESMSIVLQSPVTLNGYLKVNGPSNQNSAVSGIKIVNDTPFQILYTMDKVGSDVLGPYSVCKKALPPVSLSPGFNPSIGYTGNIIITVVAVLSGVGQAPFNQFSVIAYEYGLDGPVQDSEYSTGRLTNIGNGSSVGNTTANIVNDGQSTGTNVVEATKIGSSGSNLLLTNDGLVQIAEYVGATFTKLFQINPGAATALLLGAIGRLTEVLGSLQVDANLTVNGNASVLGNITAVNETLSGLLLQTLAGNNFLTGDVWIGGQSTILAQAVIHANGSAEFAGNVQMDTTALVTGILTANNAGNNIAASKLNAGINLVSGLGVLAEKDVIDAGGGGITYFKGLPNAGNGTAILQGIGTGSAILVSGGLNSIVANGNNGITFASAKFGRTSAGDLLDANGTDFFAKGNGGSFRYQSKNGTTTWSRIQESTFSGTGTGTFNHGVGGVPSYVTAICDAVSSSQTMGLTGYTSTQVTITTGAALHWFAKAERF